MRCFLFISIRDHLIEFGCFQHQRFLTVTSCRQNLQGIQITAFFFISVQDRFDTDGCIQNIRTGISFKRCKSFNIKNIIFGCLVGQVSVFDCRKSYNFCSRSCIFFFDAAVVHDFFIHFFVDITNQIFQTHHTAFSCLERFPVFSVHGTKTKERQFGIIFYHTCFFGTAEYLNKMHLLTFVYHIHDLIRIVFFHTFHDSSKVCGRIQSSTIRF